MRIKKEAKNLKRKRESIFLIMNLVLSIIAVSFLISLTNIKVVSAQPQEKVWIFTEGEGAIQVTPEKATELGKTGYESKDALNKFLSEKTNVPAGTPPPQDSLSGMLGFSPKTNLLGYSLVEGAYYAAIWYGIGMLIGNLAGFDKKQTQAVSTALAGGVFTYKFVNNYFNLDKGLVQTGKPFGLGSFGWGLIAGAIIFAVMYKKTSTETITFNCNPWQAPTGSRGGNDCEKCNQGDKDCSEYRCKSLGQACQLLNQGTDEEKCDWVNPQDTTSPIIKVWEEVLTAGYKYNPITVTRPPSRGVEILKTDGDGCVKAFTPLEFGIITNEPAQCKIDYNHTIKFDDMAYWFGESNLFHYNHSQILKLPSPSSIEAVAPELKHNGTYTLYVRCQDANENSNVDEFAIRFCVEGGPDTTPPKIEGTSIANNMPVKFNQTSVEIDVYVNEPAECRWGREDRGYDDLEYDMECKNEVWEMNNNLVYTCTTTLTGIKDRQENIFYFRCKDQPWLKGTPDEGDRNPNQEGYKYTLIGTETLNIIDVKPNGTIKGSTEVVSVNIEVETANGYKNGEAVCYFSETKNEADWVEFRETGTELHKQRLDLVTGDYKYYIKCVDLGGNRDDNYTEFRVETDRTAPAVARVFKKDELLKIITTEESDCRYSIQSCNFNFEDGIDMPYANQTEHVAEWRIDDTYYIRCSDKYGNMPLSNQCSIIVRPYNVVEQKVED